MLNAAAYCKISGIETMPISSLPRAITGMFLMSRLYISVKASPISAVSRHCDQWRGHHLLHLSLFRIDSLGGDPLENVPFGKDANGLPAAETTIEATPFWIIRSMVS